MKTRVVNISRLPEGWQDDPKYVYCGRGNKWKNLPHSPFHNPFIIGKGKPPLTRDGVCDAADDYLEEKVRNDEVFADLIEACYGKWLVCWCAPQRCHCDSIARIAERLHQHRIDRTSDPPLPSPWPGEDLTTHLDRMRQQRLCRERLCKELAIEARYAASTITGPESFSAWRRRYFSPIVAEDLRASDQPIPLHIRIDLAERSLEE